jgi:hypothetical protein
MMAGKSRNKMEKTADEFPRKDIPVLAGETEKETYRNHAAAMTSPELSAMRVISASERNSGLGDEIDVPALMETLRDHAAAANRGDMTQPEAMLINQASALQNLFARLTEKAMSPDHMPIFEVFMRMALGTQSQCRTTLETLSAIKNPPIVYAKQANIAQGHQQVNNGITTSTQAREVENEQNQLLERNDGERLDTRTAGSAGEADTELAALGKIDRAEVRGR